MKKYMIRRLLISILTLFILVTIVWILVRLLPGDPLNSDKVTPQIRANLEAYYGLDKPLLQQYFQYIFNLLRGDLGYSFVYESWTVNKIIAQGFPYSAALGLRAIIFGTVFGVALGVAAALRRGKLTDYVAIIVAVIGACVPNFVIASFIQFLFATKLNWLPPAGWDGFLSTILPVFALGYYSVAYQARLMRTSMLEVANKEYIKTARAKGLSKPQIIFKYQIRNAIIPIITVLGPTLASVLTGSFIIESIFAIPGIGKYYIQGVQTMDYTLILGLSLFYGIFIVVCNFVVDILYGIIDPRIRLYD